nr:hypothetical protein [Eubacteriales bacterium]
MNIKILDSSLIFRGIIDNPSSCIKTLIHGDMSKAYIVIGSSKNNADLLTKGSFFYIDDDKEHLFIITEDPENFDQNGKFKSVVAYDVFWIFKGRASNTGASALSYSSKSVEYVTKDLIDKAIISATDTDRQISYIETAANNDKGSTINATVNQTQLDTDIVSLLAIDGLGLYGEYDSTNKKIVVDVYEGDDRSVNNTDGNSPVIFDVKYNN